MAKQRKSIKLLPHERQLLVDLYLHVRIPIDQFESRPDDLKRFTEEWHELTGRRDASGDLIHYMRTQRKQKLWVKLDGNHTVAPPLAAFSAEDTEIIVQIHKENVAILGTCSDAIAYDSDLQSLVAKAFAECTGRIVPSHLLAAKLTALRKRGRLDRAEKIEANAGDIGFKDIDQATGT